MTDRAADGDTHYEACEGIDCPCYLAGTRRTLSPFRTVDWNGNVYRIEHGNVATDAPTTVTLVPLGAGGDEAVTDTDERWLECDDWKCFFHGTEPITKDTFRVCGECWHAWTAEALLADHNAILDEIDKEHGPGNAGAHLTDPEKVFACPLCIHDF